MFIRTRNDHNGPRKGKIVWIRIHNKYRYLGSNLRKVAGTVPDLVHEDLALGGLGHVDHLLNDIVGVLVLHHDVEGGGGAVAVDGAHLLNEGGALPPAGVLHALLHHVAGKLVLGQVQHLPTHSAHWTQEYR